jgi:hypothetical protein
MKLWLNYGHLKLETFWLYALANFVIAPKKIKMPNLGLKFIMDGINGRLSLMNKSARV